jgi:hypothetical protein
MTDFTHPSFGFDNIRLVSDCPLGVNPPEMGTVQGKRIESTPFLHEWNESYAAALKAT